MPTYRGSETIYALKQSDYSPSNQYDYLGSVKIGDYYTDFRQDYNPGAIYELIMPMPIIGIKLSLSIGSFSVTLDDAVAGFIGQYDSSVTRYLTSKVTSILESTLTSQNKTAMQQEQAFKLNVKTTDNRQQASPLFNVGFISTDNATKSSIKAHSVHEQASSIISKTGLVTEQATKIHKDLTAELASATMLSGSNRAVVEQMTKVYPDKLIVSVDDSSVSVKHTFKTIYLDPPYIAEVTLIEFNSYTPNDIYDLSLKLSQLIPDAEYVGLLRINSCSSRQLATPSKIKRCVPVDKARRPPRGRTPWNDDPRPDPIPDPPSGATYTVPIQEVYTMQHTKYVTLDDLTDISMDNLSLKFDADSFAWQFSGVLLDESQLSLVKPLPDGSPIKLIVTINGYVFHVLVDQISHKRTFGNRTIALTGRGISSLLAAPNKQATSGIQGSLLGIQQLADLHVPSGWTIDWQTVTWNIPAGAYSWQDRTPLQAIADIAAAAGAMVLPGRDSQTLTIKPRYPVLPWNFAGTTVDVAISDAAILELTHRQSSQQFANGVYVHGSEVGGKLGWARLTGTAGDVLMQTQSNALMTDVIGLRALSERLLASEYTQPEISSFKTEMDGTIIPLLEVGTFIGVTVDSVETKAIVNGIELTANGPDVEQTVTLGEQTTNQWIAFKSLLPKDPLLVGTIASTTGTTSIIQLIDGGTVNVRGTGTVSDKVYIRSGQIQGEAPNMVQNEIVI